MTNIFTAIGISTSFVFGVVIFLMVVDFISNEIHEAIWVYKYKHRFDKPPTASCYCIDCKFHGDDVDLTRCTNRKDVILDTADEWFCQAAEPKERG
jgi:hypothetical protein